MERELKVKKEAKWKDDADPLRQMERFLKGKREAEEREERRKLAMEKEMTERERQRGHGRTPENDDIQSRKLHRSTKDDKEAENRHRHRDKSNSRDSVQKQYRRHDCHHHRSHSPVVEKKLERLRAERDIREVVEKDRIANFIKKEKNNDRYECIGYGGYSAQFHPEAVR
jgi:hypothetical protein